MLTFLLTVSMFAALSVSAGAEETVTAVPEVAGVSVTLDGSVGLNIFVNENGCEDYSVSYYVNGYTDQVVINFSDEAEPVYSDDNQYRIYTFQLPASQMNDNIKFTVTYGDGEDDYAEYNYSVAQYAKEIISGNQDTYLSDKGFTSGRLDALKALCKSMLYYGAQAQIQFQYNTGSLANEGVEYTASAIDSSVFEGLDQYESYPNESGDWMIRSNPVHAFVNSYDWENVYAHIVLIDYKYDEGEGYYIEFFTEDTVKKLTKSGETYQAEGDEAAKDIYYFDSALSDYYVVYTDSENSLKDTGTENYCWFGLASSMIIRNLDNEAGTFDNEVFSGIDFVNSQNWTDVSAKVTYSVFDEEKWESVEVTEDKELTKTSVTSSDGSDIYRLVLSDGFSGTVIFTGTSGNSDVQTVETDYESWSDGYVRYYPYKKLDDMGVNFGMAYSGSSIGLLDRIGYSLFFKIYDSDKTEASSFYYVSSPDSENPVKTEIESYIFPGYYDEYKCYSIRDLSPCDLLSPLTVEFIREDITKDYQFSMLSYIKRVMGLSDSNESNVQLKATVTALYDYAVKADAFFNYTENSGE